MNFRLTAVLFAVVLALVVGLLIYAAFFTPDPAVATDGPFAPLTSAGVKADAVTGVEIARTSPRDEKLVFAKTDGKWRLTSPADAGVDSAAVDELVRGLLALKPQAYDGTVERANTDLTKPEVTIKLTAGDKSAAVHVGKTTFGNNGVTFMVSAADDTIRPMAVLTSSIRSSLFRSDAKDGPPATMVKWRTDFRPRSLLATDLRDAEADSDAVGLSRGDKTLALARKDGEWRFSSPPLGAADVNGASEPDPARFTGVRPLLNAILFLQTNGPADVTEDVPAADLGKFGLASADIPLTVSFTPKGRPAQILLIGKKVTDKDGKPLVPTRHYMKLGNDAAVFAVTTDAVEKLLNTLADPTSLQNRDLIPPAKLAQIDAVDSSVGGGFKLRKLAGESWAVYGGGGEPADAQVQAVQNLLGRLAAPRVAASVLPAPDDAAFEAANLQAVLKVWVGGVKGGTAKAAEGKLPAEPAVSGDPAVLVQIGRQFTKKVTRPDGTAEDRPMVVVRRTLGTASTDLEVPLEAVGFALQPRIKFVKAVPPTFEARLATGLTLFRDKARTEVVKHPTAIDPAYRGGVWNFTDEKKTTADADAAGELLARLATMSPSLVMEKADDPTALGLNPADPKLSATVTLPNEKGGTRTEVFHFGEPVKGDDKSVYMKAVDKPFVYAAPVDLFTRLRTADLTDKVAFRLDPAKVKKVSVRGWVNSTPDKTQVKLTAERQGGTWVATEPPGVTADAALLDQWLEALKHPKGVGPAPVEPGKEPPAAYGLGFEGVSLLVVSAGEKPTDPDVGLSVTLGAVVAEKGGVYARLSDGRVFLLDARPFADVLARPPVRK